MKIALVAGEASGDLHAANLVKALKTQRDDLEFFGFGGDKMQAEGVRIDKHYHEMAFMGFVEVLKNLGKIKANFKALYKILETEKPDKIILIDFPGFNLRVAKWAKERGIEVVYYVSPQIWAWKKGRVHTIKKVVDKMLCILPFEKDFYAKYDYDAHFVGHPLLDAIEDIPYEDNGTVALLPGSRTQEIHKMLPTMLKLAEQHSDKKFIVVKAPSQSLEMYESQHWPSNVTLSSEGTAKVLSNSSLAIVTSGTATLETALYNVPQVVAYKGSAISIWIARLVIKVKYISLVNLILDKPLLKELIQDEFTLATLTKEFELLLTDKKKKEILNGYEELKQKLGNKGASARAAELVLS
jgi:lipid-A-disaccharide synthase